MVPGTRVLIYQPGLFRRQKKGQALSLSFQSSVRNA